MQQFRRKNRLFVANTVVGAILGALLWGPSLVVSVYLAVRELVRDGPNNPDHF